MGFVKAKIEIRPASIGTGVKCGLRKSKGGRAFMTVFLNLAVAKEMNLADKDKVEVMIGEKEVHGLIRMRKNNSAGQAPAGLRSTGRAGFFAVKLGHQEAFVDRSELSRWCQWEKVEDGWIEIVLPKWANETAPGGRRREVTEAPAQPAAPRGVSVTSHLMGDPDPGRRDAVEKIGRKEALVRVGSMKA